MSQQVSEQVLKPSAHQMQIWRHRGTAFPKSAKAGPRPVAAGPKPVKQSGWEMAATFDGRADDVSNKMYAQRQEQPAQRQCNREGWTLLRPSLGGSTTSCTKWTPNANKQRPTLTVPNAKLLALGRLWVQSVRPCPGRRHGAFFNMSRLSNH